MLRRDLLKGIAAAGAATTMGADRASAQDTIRIGACLSLTGGFQTVGRQALAGAKLYMQLNGVAASELTPLEVAQAYLDVVRDQALVEVQRNNVAVLRKQLEATQDRFRVGEVTRTDVAQAESSLAQAQGTLVAQQGTLEISRAEYIRAVGHPPGTLILPRERPALPATREEALSLASNANFSVISAKFAELASRDNIDVVRGQLLPQISVVGTLSRTYDQSSSFKGVLTLVAISAKR